MLSAPPIARTPAPPASPNSSRKSAMGFLMEKELKYLQGELEKPAKPFVVILGGAKVSDKIGVIKALMEKADTILIGGAMANTFWKAQGVPVGTSRVEDDKLDLARELAGAGERERRQISAAGRCARDAGDSRGAPTRNTGRVTAKHGIADGWQAVDIGRATIALFTDEIAKAKTILVERAHRHFRDSRILPTEHLRSRKRWRDRMPRPSSAAAIPSPR